MKKIFLLTLSASLLGGSLFACGLSKTSSSLSPTKMSKVNFAYEAVSSLSLVDAGSVNLRNRMKLAFNEVDTGGSTGSSSESSSSSTSSPSSTSSSTTSSSSSSEIEQGSSESSSASSDDKKTIENFLPEARLILNDKARPTSIEKSTSDKEGYESKETIVMTDIYGKESSLTLYYNLTASSDWESLDDDDEDEKENDDDEKEDDEKDDKEKDDSDDENEDKDDDDEEEYEFSKGSMYKGIIIDGDSTYFYESKEATITEGTESVKTIAMRMSREATYTNYVQSFYELEKEDGDTEESFSYEIYENDKLL